MGNKLKVLFLGPRPRDQATLELRKEIEKILASLVELGVTDRIEFQTEWAVRFEDLTRLLLEHRPDVVHLSGHGAEGLLAFEDDLGKTEIVRKEALLALFNAWTVREGVKLVVLNVCSGASIAQELAHRIKFAIGTEQPITDSSAIAFSKGFYQALAHGVAVQDAFDLGHAQFVARSAAGASQPKLFNREDADPRCPLVAPSAGPAAGAAYCIHHAEDEGLFKELSSALAPLRRQGLFSLQHGHPGDVAIEQLADYKLLLLIVTPHLINDDDSYALVEAAMRLHPGVRVIPILARRTDTKGLPFAQLAPLPPNGRPVAEWSDRDSAWYEVAQGLRLVVGPKKS